MKPANTRKGNLKFIYLVIVSSFITISVLAQNNQNNAKKNTNAAKNVNAKAELIDFQLNDFENAEDWRAFSTTPLGDTKIRKTLQIGDFVENKSILNDEEKKQFVPGQNHILGVKTFIKNRGIDRVEVRPPHEYIIKGVSRQISFWALGRKFRHTIYIKLRDYTGKIHKLRAGRLDYLGWRKMTITIPGWLPQSKRYSLYEKNLRFVSLFVESDRNDVRGDFYFYIDDLRVKVDKTDMAYPGSQIRDTW